MNELKETVDLMLSEDYKVRFQAEYSQIAIRIVKLNQMLEKWDRDELDFIPKCPKALLKKQLVSMIDYRIFLEIRAEIEGICLDSPTLMSGK